MCEREAKERERATENEVKKKRLTIYYYLALNKKKLRKKMQCMRHINKNTKQAVSF